MAHIEIHEQTLANGLRVIVSPDHGSPVVSVNVTYRVGSINERRGRTGLAHLFEHLMFDNTQTGVEKQYDKYCTKAGGSNNAYTTYDNTTYFINLPTHQLELGLWLEAERMRGFAITDNDLAVQQRVVIEEIKQNVDNQPYMKWSAAMDRAAYAEDSSYSWTVYGEKEDVAAVTLADIKEFYNNHYHPANAVLVIGGDVTPDEGFAKAEEAFGQIAQHASTDRITHTVDQLRKGEHVVVPDNVPIPAVFLAFHVPSMLSVEMFAVDLASTILSAGKRATLYRDLVVDQQVASAAGTFIDRRANSSLLIHYAYAARPGVETDQLAEALLTSVARTKVSPTDRERVVNRMRTAFAAEHQRVGSRADSLAWAATFLGDSQEVNNTMNKYSSRTLDQIQNILAIASDAEKIVRVDVVPA